MAKKSLHVGINNYGYPGANLQGCLNDAADWSSLLMQHYDVPSGDVTMLTDANAHKRGIVQALKALLTGAKPRDVLVFTFSGHGTYVTDSDGDEPNADEAMCPYGLTDLLIDDELRQLFANVPKGVRLTVISDSCFSGTVTRQGLFDPSSRQRRTRFLPPLLIDHLVGRGRGGGELPIAPGRQRRMKYPQASMTHLLLSGCTDRQYSYDAVFGRRPNGAMSYYALKAIREGGYRLSYRKLIARMNPQLVAAKFDQTPQLEGPSTWKHRQLFV